MPGHDDPELPDDDADVPAMPSCGVDVPCPTHAEPFPPEIFPPPAPPPLAEVQIARATALCESVRAAVDDAELLPDCSPDSPLQEGVLPISLGGLATVLEEAQAAKGYSLALFYGERCPFSRVLAPTYEALAAAFPQLWAFKVEGSDGGRLNSRLGIRSFPTLVLLKGDSVHRMLYQRRLPDLVGNVTNATGLAAVGSELEAAADGTEEEACESAIDAGALEGGGMQFFNAFVEAYPLAMPSQRWLGRVSALNESYLDPPAYVFGSVATPVDWLLVVALAFLAALVTVLLTKRSAAAPAGGVREADRGCCWMLVEKAAGRISALASVLDSPAPPDAGPIAEGTKLRVFFGDSFEGIGANWAVRIRSNPTLDNTEGRVLGHVRNGETLTATGRTEREFVHVRFGRVPNDKVGWMAMHWEGYKMLEVLPEAVGTLTPAAQGVAGGAVAAAAGRAQAENAGVGAEQRALAAAPAF